MVKISILAAALLATAGTVIAGPVSPFNAQTKRIFPMFNANKTVVHGAPITGTMKYGGGPIMTNPTNVYYIYYGSGFAASDKAYLENLASGISSHPYFNSEKTYYSQSGSTKTFINGPVTFKKAIVDNYSLGKSLSDATVQSIVTNHVNKGELPLDVDAVYFVLTAPDVKETTGFCTQYCGWHNNFALNGNDIKFSFIGNPASCLAGCAPDNVQKSPNGNPGVDAMPSIITHELMEAMSDPDPPSGWTDATGYENADKCAYVYGTELTDSATGGKYNTQIGKYKYLIQQNWDLKLNGCYNHPVSGGASNTTSPPVSPPVPPPTSATVTPPIKTTDTTTSTTTPPSSCKEGSDTCLSADGTGNYYNECVGGALVKKDCRKTAGKQYPFCYKYSATDVYCDK